MKSLLINLGCLLGIVFAFGQSGPSVGALPVSSNSEIRPPIFPGCEKIKNQSGDEIVSCFENNLSQRIMSKVSKNHIMANELFGEVYFRYIVGDNGEIRNVLIYGDEELKNYMEDKFFEVIDNMKSDNEKIQPAINKKTGEPEWMIFTTSIKLNKK